MGSLLEGGGKTPPQFSFPRRWRRSQRCWEYPSKHRRDRCERRALLDYFKRRCFHHHVGQPDTPPGVLGFVLILYLMFFQQAAGIHIQMFGEPIYRHIRLNRLGQLGGAAFPFPVVSRHDLCYGCPPPFPAMYSQGLRQFFFIY